MRRSIFLLSVVLAALAAGLTFASDNNNAATWYNRAFVHLDKLSEADWDLIRGYWDDPSAPPPQGLRDALARVGPAIDLARRGSRQMFIEYDLDYSRGYEMLLPHLSLNRSLAKIMHVSALVKFHDGDSAAAADYVASMYRMAEHCGYDRITISPLVGRAMYKLAEQTAQVGFDRASFNAIDCEAMLSAMRRLEGSDPFNMVEGVIGEREIGLQWLGDQFGGAEDRADVSLLLDLFGAGDDAQAAAVIANLSAMTDEEFQAELGSYDQLLGDVVEGFLMEDRQAGREHLQRVEEAVAEGEYGQLVKLTTACFTRIFDLMMETEQQIAERIAMLEGLVTGEIKPEEQANAALYYMRGIELMGKIQPERFKAVREFDAGDTNALNEELIETLTDAQGAIDLFREGSTKRRCDFSFLRPGRAPMLCPDYLAGMRDAMRLLHVDAVRLLKSGDADSAADRLSICYRVVGHLTDDEPILSALLAHRVFDRTHELAAGALRSETLADPQRNVMLDAIERIGRKDPFGYIGSILTARKAIADQLIRSIAGTNANKEMIGRAKAVVAGWDGDQLLYMLVVLDTMSRAAVKDDGDAEHVEASKSDPLDRLGDVVSLEGLEEVRREVHLVAPMLAQGRLDIFQGREIPLPGRVALRMRSARGDLRRGLALLRPPAENTDAGAGD